MPTYIIGGRRIRTEVPLSEADIEEIAASLGVTAAPQTAQKPEESPGFFQSIGKGTESLISSGRTALGTVFGSPEEAARAGIQRGEEISKRYGEGLSLDKLKEVYEKEGLLSAAGEVASAIPGAIGEQLPNIGAMATSARLGAAAGSVFGPYGTAAGALLGLAAPSLVQQYGSDVERQAAEQQARGEAVNIDRARALEAAAPQAALDVVGEAIPLGGKLAGKLFGKEVQSLIFRGERAAADKLAKESLLTTLGKGTAIGALAEVPTEVAQQALERWNAGLSLTDDDALKEYADTAFQVSLLAPIGAVGRVSERAAARSELAAGAPETPETPETPEAPTTEEAPPAPKPVEVSPEALAAAKEYSDQIASGRAQFNLFKGRALIRKMGYQIGNDSKFADTKAIFDDLVSGKQVEMPKAGAPAAPAEPVEPIDISTLTSGQFVPREETPRGTATPPVGEAVDTTTGRGAVMPPSGVGAAEPSVAGPQGAGVGPAVGAVETPDVREGAVQPALTETPAVEAPAIEAAKPIEVPAVKEAPKQGELFRSLSHTAPAYAQMSEYMSESLRLRIGDLNRRLERGKITAEEHSRETIRAYEETRKERPVTERLRGMNRIMEVLNQGVRQGHITPETEALTSWFLRKNPAMADDLAFTFKQNLGPSTLGTYQPIERLVSLLKGAAKVGETSDTPVHETLHHLERMLPKDIQGAIRKEWAKQLSKEFDKTDNEKVKQFLNHLYNYHFGEDSQFTSKERAGMMDSAFEMIKNREVPSDLYKYVNPSEFFAVKGADILSNRFKMDNTVINRLRRWLREFIEKAKSIFGMRSDAPLLKGIDSVIKGEGKFQPDAEMLYEKTGSYASVKSNAPPPSGPVDNKNRTPEQAIKARQDTYKERFTKKSLSERILKYLWGKDAGGHLLDKYEALVKKFQNDLRPALTLEQALKRAGELITYGPGMNDAFSKIASAQDKAAWLTSNMLKVPMDKAYKAIEKFARSRNLTTDQAIEELDRYRIVLHEPERRMIMFMRYVPLSTKRRAFKDSTGKTIQISPAEIRDSILRSLVKPGNDLVANGQAKQLHNVLKALVSDKANLDPLGDSPIKKEGKPLSIDINDDQYSVLAGYSPEFIAKWKQTFDALGTQKPTAEAAIKAIEDVQEVTKELNRQANYWTKPVDNIVAFYNFEHYTPFKGVPGTKVRVSAEMTDPNDVRISGEFADADQAMEGRESEADNSVLQSFSDAMYAASRAGRAGVTEAVKNLIEQGHVSGRKIAEITHEQRWLDKDFNLRQYKGKNKLFHYTPDGNIEVYQIANKDLGFLEAIRRPYQVENWTTKMANNLTGFMGQMHTRFSPSFAPLNFPRDVFTNTMSISADIGGKEALNYLSDALFRNVMKGGLFKSGKVSKLISENRIGELRALAKKDPFYADVIELMEEGGRTAYQQAYNIQAQASELEKRLGPDGIVKMGREGAETLGKWADMYNDAFEFTNRVSAYGIMKSNSMAKLKQRFREKNRREPNAQELEQINKAARSEAASFTKNLANFRLIGTAGRQAGGLFMFFRASATGAVRAIDSLLPAFIDEKTALSKAPASIRDNPELAKRFLKDYRENKKRAQYTMYATAAAGAFLYGLALAGADDDDQGRNKVATDDMARWTRYARLPILGKDTVLQIPWGFGMASFGAIGAQVAALASGNQPAKDAAANIINIATDSFIPLPKSNINVFDNFFGFLVDSATPTLVRPIVEFAMNTDSLGNEIYNSRQSKLSDAFTGGTNVPELYRDAARGLLESTGLSISPNTLYFWMANYADALSRVATSTYDLRLFANGQREFRGVDDLDKVLIPFDSFIGTKSNYDGRQYENVKNQIEDKQKILKSLEQRPEAYVKYVEKHPMDPDLVDYYNKTVNGELKDLQEAANVVRVSDQLTPQQRRDILKENVRMQNMLKRGLIDSFKYYGLKPTN